MLQVCVKKSCSKYIPPPAMDKETERNGQLVTPTIMRTINWDKYKIIHFAHENKNLIL